MYYFLFLGDVADRFDLLRQFCVIHWFPYWTGISLCTGLESDFAASCISTFLSTLLGFPKIIIDLVITVFVGDYFPFRLGCT